ncbi:MAG: hypothetical protein M3275_00210 [Thermoproteota archaeon]|nr:hypothetical protein [Thermoproteota archaeon]
MVSNNATTEEAPAPEAAASAIIEAATVIVSRFHQFEQQQEALSKRIEALELEVKRLQEHHHYSKRHDNG